MFKSDIIKVAVIFLAIAARLVGLRVGYRTYISNFSFALSPRPADYSTTLITVVERGYCILENDSTRYTKMPPNMLLYEVGDQFILETDGLMLASYPAQFSKVYSYKLKGHLSGDELKKVQDDVERYNPVQYIYP